MQACNSLKANNFAMDYAIVHTLGLKEAQISLYNKLLHRAAKDKFFIATYDEITASTTLSRKTVIEYIKELERPREELGGKALIEKTSRRGKGTLIKITDIREANSLARVNRSPAASLDKKPGWFSVAKPRKTSPRPERNEVSVNANLRDDAVPVPHTLYVLDSLYKPPLPPQRGGAALAAQQVVANAPTAPPSAGRGSSSPPDRALSPPAMKSHLDQDALQPVEIKNRWSRLLMYPKFADFHELIRAFEEAEEMKLSSATSAESPSGLVRHLIKTGEVQRRIQLLKAEIESGKLGAVKAEEKNEKLEAYTIESNKERAKKLAEKAGDGSITLQETHFTVRTQKKSEVGYSIYNFERNTCVGYASFNYDSKEGDRELSRLEKIYEFAQQQA